ncbi:hypothetical protein JOD29_000817 [Lysinibacillus composti]|uniref:Uncharacterized protein n=1 Tax=Lysinibacillus composti TaxID=720633 RepID=A0A3N9UTV6_9BACI|nr:hypothetical protein [Lysinibacillus composti]MBM7607573.1 hypothetical protein [Lysinibacillus composti]RQW75922.1 hypothetical protein EBB45_04710 [Lysinibacillus composti]
MITYKKIKTAVNRKLKETFGLEINSKDISEGFKRPSFFIEFDEVKRDGSVSQVEKSMIIRIYYFPKTIKESSIEILEIQEQLGDVFDMKLIVEDRQLNITEPNFNVTDGVLQFEFDIAFEDGRIVSEEYELMEELDIDIQKG